MKEYCGFRVYFGFYGWGWKMIGIGYKHKWFFGYSINMVDKND